MIVRHIHALRHRVLLLPLLAFSLLCSCSAHKGAGSSTTPRPQASAAVSSEAPSSRFEGNFESLVGSYREWQTLRIPLDLRIEKPVSLSIGGTVTMQAGKDVYLSLKMLGFEVASACVTSDSIFVAYKPSKIYVAERLEKILADFPVTVDNLQQLLLGHLFVAGRDHVAVSDIALAQGSRSGSYTVTPSEVRGIKYSFVVDKTNTLTNLIVTPPRNSDVICTYGKAVTTPCGPVASSLGVKAQAAKTLVEVSLDWDLSRARWQNVEPRRWTAPKGYRRVAPEAIIHSLSAF